MRRPSIAMEIKNGAISINGFNRKGEESFLVQVMNTNETTSTWMSREELNELSNMIDQFMQTNRG